MTTGTAMTDMQSGALTPLAGILLSSLDALVAGGQADLACRLAGEACAVLRGRDETGWRRFNAFLHRSAKYISSDDITTP
jgi:hypothetical protein